MRAPSDGELRWAERLELGSPALAAHPRGATICAVLAAALAAVDPRVSIQRCVHLLNKPHGRALVLGEYVFDLADDPLAPGPGEHGRVWIFGAGKASAAMSESLIEQLGERVAGGVVVVKHAPPALEPPRAGDPALVLGRLGAVEFVCGDHPIPGAATASATAYVRARADAVAARDLVLAPISGGASALLSEPLLPPPSWVSLLDHLLSREVSIQAINRLRRRFDSIKAGGLASSMGATLVSLIISDVSGDELALVGSGPTVFPTQAELQGYDAFIETLAPKLAGLDPALIQRLRAPPPPPPLTRADGRPCAVHHVLVARNGDARDAACRRAQAEGLESLVLLPALAGPADAEGRRLAQLLARWPAGLPLGRPACVVTGGETTVDLGPTRDPRGGRNQELALAALAGLAGRPGLTLVTLASDGEDGPTDAAGAVVSGSSLERALAIGLDPDALLRDHRSHEFFSGLGDLIRCGPTGTNVCDLAFLFAL